MLKYKIFRFVLRDFRSYLSKIENICESELELLSYSDDDDIDTVYHYDSMIVEIHIVKSWLTDYEYKLGIKK